jgi:hypothetical protein
MPADDRAVYEYFCSDPAYPVEVNWLAYASFAFDKYEWVRHFEAREGRAPDESELDRWIADLPESRLVEIRSTAAAFFEEAAQRFMQPEIEQQLRAARESGVIDVVRRATSFRSTFLPNLVVGVVASVMFSVLIILAAVIFERDPSPFAFFKGLQDHGAASTAPKP